MSDPFTIAFNRLQTLYQKTSPVNSDPQWQARIKHLTHLAQTSQWFELKTQIQALCQEIASNCQSKRDQETLERLKDFLKTAELREKFEIAQSITNKENQKKALLDLLLSNELQQFLSEKMSLYLTNQASSQDPSSHSSLGKKNQSDNVVAHAITETMNLLDIWKSQTAYDDIGRLTKMIMILQGLLLDALLINWGFEPIFNVDHGQSRNTQNIMPLKMSL